MIEPHGSLSNFFRSVWKINTISFPSSMAKHQAPLPTFTLADIFFFLLSIVFELSSEKVESRGNERMLKAKTQK